MLFIYYTVLIGGFMEKIGNIVNQIVKDVKEKKEEIKTEQKEYAIAKKEDTVSVEQNTMELMLVLNTTQEEQEKGIARRELGNGRYIEIQALRYGELCKREDITTLLVCFLLLKHAEKRKGCSFETTYYQISRMLGGTGGKDYKDIKNSLDRLSDNKLKTNFWWDTIAGERITKSKFSFLSRTDESETKEHLRIIFDRYVAESMEQGYIKFLEEKNLKDILKIKSYFAKTLVLLFMKRFWEGNPMPHNLDTILEYLGIKEKYKNLPRWRRNDYIKRHIIPAVQEAARFLGYTAIYNDTGAKNEMGEIIRDPKGEEKFRFYKEQQKLPFGV